ncbi:autophagy-related protein 27-domain-containing protein [Chaetomium sp. MPI-SDFR-AT-0129]|nr:autophagy-related protein 27-domain-containing protein [Chaetomium sp. MPI-SDFR-AT-0129]
MKPFPTWLTPATLTSLLLLTPTATTASTTPASPLADDSSSPLACDNIQVEGGHTYNLQALAGPHVVVTGEYTRPTYHNTTYAIDVCGALEREGEGEGCPGGTRGMFFFLVPCLLFGLCGVSILGWGFVDRVELSVQILTEMMTVCAIKHRWNRKEDKMTGIDQVIPLVVGDDKAVTWQAKRLPADGEGKDDAPKDGKKEGLRLTLQSGATYQDRAQRAVVEFRCNPDLEGTEEEWESVDKYKPAKGEKARREEKDDDKKDDGKKDDGKKDDNKKDGDKVSDPSTPERQVKKDDAALVWGGYKRERDADGKELDTLYLTWYTKHVCDVAVDQPAKESESWGFFTWFVILVFLGIAAYLIFGSWLNYNRYGARGWDLLPHGDTLRDAPYLMKDLIRRALNTLQSTGSRGGYSAV